MKKLYTTFQYKQRNQKRSNKEFRKKILRKERLKANRRNQEGYSKNELRDKKLAANYHKVKAPEKLTIFNNYEETFRFISQLESNYIARKKTFVNIRHVEEIDYGAIALLVSVMFLFKEKSIDFNGNFPKNDKIKKQLIDSDFFKHLKKPIRKKVEYALGKPHQIFTRANRKVVSELGYAVMKESSLTIWGQKRTLKGLQRILLELMQNTNEHAHIEGRGKERWWLSVNHNKENKKVTFIFVDYGVGIFKSLYNKTSNSKWFYIHKIKDRIQYGHDTKILRMLLEGELHKTVTGQSFRGKGLPGIKQVHKRNGISNLNVITNNVYADVSKGIYKLLANQFSGTMLYWEIDQNNNNLPWIE